MYKGIKMRNMTPKQRAWQVTHQTDEPLEEGLIEMILRQAVDQERERCAEIADNWLSPRGVKSFTGEEIARKIRGLTEE